MIEYLKYFFNPGHLFSLRPEAMQLRAIIILAIVFTLFIVAGIINKIIIKKTKDALKVKGLRRLTNLSLVMGILGFAYLFFAWQGVALLASRSWLLIWLITVIVWLFFILKYLYSEAPKIRKEIDSKRDFEKYIP